MADVDLRQAMHRLADDAAATPITARVMVATRQARRRRAAVLAAAVAVVVAAVSLGLSSAWSDDDDHVPPAQRRGVTVDLGSAQVGGVADPVLAVAQPATGRVWLVSEDGAASLLPAHLPTFRGGVPQLSGRAGLLTAASAGGTALVSTSTGIVRTRLPVGYLRAPAVSPDGSSVGHVRVTEGKVDLVLEPLGDGSRVDVTVRRGKAAGSLLPVAWSDDGAALLVLDSNAIARVQVEPSVVAAPWSYLPDPVDLANGWAVAPDVSRVAMAESRTIDRRLRRWHLLDADTGRSVGTLTRPLDERLIGWDADGALLWWRPVDGGYRVIATDLSGGSRRFVFYLPSDGRVLNASWAADGP